MKEKLLIIGASGHGKVVANIAMKMNMWKCIAFLDDNDNISTPLGLEILGKTKDFHKYIEHFDFFVGIGNNSIRKKIQKELENNGVKIPVLVHPRAVIGDEVILGPGTVVMGGVVINCCSKIGKGCIINTGVTIDHDNLLEDFVHVSPGSHLAGTVKVGMETWLGIGSIVSNNVSITSGCIMGAGAVIVDDILEAGVYIGVPVRKIKEDKNFNTR